MTLLRMRHSLLPRETDRYTTSTCLRPVLGVVDAQRKASLHPRPSVRGYWPYPTRGDPVNAEHSGSKGANLEKQPPILGCGCRAYGMNGSGLVCLERPHWEPGDLPDVHSLTKYGALLGGPTIPKSNSTIWVIYVLQTKVGMTRLTPNNSVKQGASAERLKRGLGIRAPGCGGCFARQGSWRNCTANPLRLEIL